MDAGRRKDFWEVDWDQGREKQSVRYASSEGKERKPRNCSRIVEETEGSRGVGRDLISLVRFVM